MTFAFGSFTVGWALLVSAFKDQSILEVILGRPGKTIAEQDSSGNVEGTESLGGSEGTEMGREKGGVGTFDGHKVANWIIKELQAARKTGLWHGSVLSGYRDPAYSEKLCLEMCGKPSCPGVCAGRSSNHSGKIFPAGATDLSDPAGFEKAMKKIHGRLKNDLPADRGHFSHTGH